MFNRNYLITGVCCLITYLIYLLAEYLITGGQMGVPLDDTWIHFQFADNFSQGYFFQFNKGEYTAGTTSPLYVIALGSLSLVSDNFIVISLILSSLFHLLSCIFIYKISLEIFRSDTTVVSVLNEGNKSPEFAALLVSLLTVFNGRFSWSALSGMETTMFTFFCILGVFVHIKNLAKSNFSILPALLISFATVSRPEGFLLFSLYILDLTLNLLFIRKFKENFFRLVLSVALFLMITFPYLVFSYKISGHFFPNTFRGQGGGLHFIPDPEYLGIALKYFINDNFITALLYSVSVVYYLISFKFYFTKLKLVNLTFLWIIFLPLISSVLIPNWRHHVRYMIPLIPFINTAAVYMLYNLTESGKFIFLRKLNLRKYGFYVILLFSFVNFLVFAAALGKNTDNINNQQVKLARWVNENVPREETIAVNDIGAIGFINKNKIIDMAGLITPEILRYRTYNWKDNLDSVNYLLKKNNVNYIIIYDEWFKEFLNQNRDNLTFITSAYLEDNTICGGKEMKIYKTNFNGNHK
ncbi:MAG: hypothetical protein JNJ56_03735 [Ignavibacteria bacterium]|nr:hypothetical protein [Ignavibacteria bacterium]